jgi:hypothetical protein
MRKNEMKGKKYENKIMREIDKVVRGSLTGG